jgi:catechol 2,3-dioxygenase-like lactoylglutathione lyase family enzyme
MDHIAISVRDLAEAEDFYTRILGGTIERRIGDTESDKESGRVPQVIIKLADSVVFNLNASNPQVPDGHFIHWAMEADFEDLDEWIETFQREDPDPGRGQLEREVPRPSPRTPRRPARGIPQSR